MQLLLFSNSTNAGEEYLKYTIPHIQKFLKHQAKKAIFIPFAGISVGFDAYARMVAEKLSVIDIELTSVHNATNMLQTIEEAELIITGGGNTFYLLRSLQENKLIEIIRNKIQKGTPYIGWSAGSNLACPTICTTNDMPIVEPENFQALNLIPFQINPHFTDFVQKGHAGETREMRINEYLLANPETYVVGLQEGTFLKLFGTKLDILGDKPCKIFRNGENAREVQIGENLDFLMQ